MKTQINGKDVKTYVVVIHLIVAKRHINVDCMVILVFNEEFLIYLCCLFEVAPKIVKSSHAQLIFNRIRDVTMVVHELVFITDLLCQLEKQSTL
jgi:hypothetical protein